MVRETDARLIVHQFLHSTVQAPVVFTCCQHVALGRELLA